VGCYRRDFLSTAGRRSAALFGDDGEDDVAGSWLAAVSRGDDVAFPKSEGPLPAHNG
jgi:hypothetical protein